MKEPIYNKSNFFFLDLPLLFKKTFLKLVHNDPLRMAGATAFFTSFALPFILLLLLQALGLVIDPYKLRHELFKDVSSLFGVQSMRQVIATLVAFRDLASNPFITIFGILFLLMVSTTLLMVIKASINQLWRIRIEHNRGFWSRLGTRLQSVLIIAGTGILFVINIIAEGAKAYLGKNISELSPALSFYFFGVVNYILSLLFVTLWFGIIFRLLPDARPPWKVAFTGAFVTAILFTIGKFVLRLLLTSGNLNSLYGTSASAVLILLFVFYTSLIMYFGATFTRVWAEYRNLHITPLPYAARYTLTDVDED
jgi:membrane protein